MHSIEKRPFDESWDESYECFQSWLFFFANQHFPHSYTLFKSKDFVAQSQLGYRLPNQNSFQIVLFIKKQD